MRLALVGIVIVAALGLGACSESREEKFEKAMRVAESAQKTVESARKEVDAELAKYEKASAAAEAAEKKLAKARSQLESAESGAANARAEVAKWADDATVFRTLQRHLLEEKALSDAAVSARVQGGVAYLEGRVAKQSQRERAVQLARETPGVVDVQDQITVASASATTPSIAPAPAQEPAPIPVDVLPAEPIPAEPSIPVEPMPAEPMPAEPVPAAPQAAEFETRAPVPPPAGAAAPDMDVYWPDKNLPR